MKEHLVKYVMKLADREYNDDFPISTIPEWIMGFFDEFDKDCQVSMLLKEAALITKEHSNSKEKKYFLDEAGFAWDSVQSKDKK